MRSERLNLTFTDSTRAIATRPEVGPANDAAARLTLRIWIGSAGFAVIYELVGGVSLYPALALVLATGLLLFALPSGRAVEVGDDALVRRGLITTRRVPWSRVKALRWSRHGGVERYCARAGLQRITLSSRGDGFAQAARRLRAIASFRNIPITAA